MTKKKSFLSLVLAFMLIIPCMFFMTACGTGDAGTGSGSGGGSGTGGSGSGTGGTGSGGANITLSSEQILENLGDNWAITIKYSYYGKESFEAWNDEIQIINDGSAILYKDKKESSARFANVLEKDGLVYSDKNVELTSFDTCEAKGPSIEAYQHEAYGKWNWDILSMSPYNPESYTISSETFLGRPCTKYEQVNTWGEDRTLTYLFIFDNETKLCVKYVQSDIDETSAEVEGFVVTAWVNGGQDVSSESNLISRGTWFDATDFTRAGLTVVATPQNAQFVKYFKDFSEQEIVYVLHVENETDAMAICQSFYSAGANKDVGNSDANFEDLLSTNYDNTEFNSYTMSISISTDYGEGIDISIRLPW